MMSRRLSSSRSFIMKKDPRHSSPGKSTAGAAYLNGPGRSFSNRTAALSRPWSRFLPIVLWLLIEFLSMIRPRHALAIIDGTEITVDAYSTDTPWLVLVEGPGGKKCTGMMVAPQWVLT